MEEDCRADLESPVFDLLYKAVFYILFNWKREHGGKTGKDARVATPRPE